MSPERANRPDRVSERTLLNAIALGLLGLGTILGIVYLGLWQGASEDLSRLLPASTRTHATTDNPLASLTRALELGGWRDPAKMRQAFAQSGLWGRPTTDAARPCLTCGVTDLAGIPVDIARELLSAMDGIEVALVPAGDESALLVFIEVRDPAARKRILARLRPHLETVDREVGFRVDRLRPRPWTSLIGFDVDPPRFVDMEPWLILSWGSATPIEELLEARVGGRHDALHRRSGFSSFPARGQPDSGPATSLSVTRTDLHPLRLVVDARSAWQIASGGEPRAGGLIEYLDLMTLTGSIARERSGFDPLELRIEISDRELAQRLTSSIARGPHPLLERVPADTELTVALRGDDLPALGSVTALLVSQLARDFAVPLRHESTTVGKLAVESNDGPPLATLLEALGLAPDLDELLAELPNAPGEIVFALVPGPDDTRDLVVLLHSDAPDALESALADAIPRWLGDDWAHGEVTRTTHDDSGHDRLYLERPHGDGAALAWRQRDGVIELASSVEALDRLATAPTLSLATLKTGLDIDTGIAALVRPSLLATSHPLTALLRDRLRPDALIAMTLDANYDRLILRSNTGLWTFIGALVSASPRELDALLLRHLTPRCRAAYEAFCEGHPAAAPCQPLAFGRLPHIEAVCRDLAP